jgi:putative Mg2+ transporter-C (MgtC) family protein
MGFIGAAAIMRRDDLVLGVTTAATLWYVTVLGLCFGGGQLGLGLAASLIGFLILTLVRRAEQRIPRERQATLTLTTDAESTAIEEIRSSLIGSGVGVAFRELTCEPRPSRRRTLVWEICWRSHEDAQQPEFLHSLNSRPEILQMHWKEYS